MISKQSKVLFFISGPVPTDADKAAAEKIESKTVRVLFRNASAIGDGDAVETCDGLAGKVPALYLKNRPNAKVYTGETNAPAPAPAPVVAAPVVATATPPAAVVPPVSVPSEPSGEVVTPPAPDAAAQQRAAEDEGARNATVAQLKQALTGLGIKFAANTNKADLLALFLNR